MAVLPEGVSWRKVTIWSVAAVAALALAVLLARFLISLPTVAAFIERYPGSPLLRSLLR
jgi:anti-sigma-K factor RskA